MKKCRNGLLLLLFTGTLTRAQPVKPGYRISPWLNDKKAAVSMTFDDGINGQFTIALPLLNAYGFKATFFVTTKTLVEQLGSWALAEKAAAGGHEISNHSLTHPHFNAISMDDISTELLLSNELIAQHIQPQKSLTHAYPYGEGGNETSKDLATRVVVKKYFIGARATRNKPLSYNEYEFARSGEDYFRINSDVIADPASMSALATEVDNTIAAGGWYVPTYHGIGNGWIIVPAAVFEKHLNELKSREKLLWIAPFATILKYHKERNCSKLLVLSENRHSWELELTDTLNDASTWNQALTIHLKTAGRKIQSIRQGDLDISFSLTVDSVIFNATPCKDKIIISKK